MADFDDDYTSSSYEAAPIQRPISAADQYRQHYANVPFYADTTHRSHYQPVEMSREPTSQSLYSNDQTDSMTPRDTSLDPFSGSVISDNTSEYRYANVPFYGDTTHRSTYVEHEIVPHKQLHDTKQDVEDDRSSIPFYGQTTNQAEYVPKFVQREVPKEQDKSDQSLSYQYSDVPFYGDTTNRVQYTKKEAERPSIFKPSNEVPYGRSRPSSASSLLSTHRSEYGPKQGERTKQYKPNNEKLWHDNKFDDQTTNRSVYDPKQPAEKTTNFRPKYSRLAPPDDANFENLTTNRSIYIPKPLAPRPDAFKPKQLRLGSLEKMENGTVNRLEFVPKHAERTKAYKPMTTVGVTDGIMQSNTTSGDAFRPWDLKKVASFKPNHQRMVDDPFDGTTTNRESYVPKHIDACPAELLLRSKSDFRHVYDKNGHRYYQKMTAGNDWHGRRNSMDTLHRETTRSLLIG